MLSHKILTRQDTGRLGNYFLDGADDYFAKTGEASQWHGTGTALLGLSGQVDRQRFKELLDGEVIPGTNCRVGTRNDSKERIGIDLTFSAPKSISIDALVGGKADIILAHDRAVLRAIDIAETLAQARSKENGKTLVERTGNLAVAAFRHETSREQDPDLHTHAVVLAITRRSDGKWVALKNDEIIKSTKYLGAVYRAELALELTKLGYGLRHGRDGNFELAHITRAQIEGFSRRSAQIEAKLAEAGLTRGSASAEEKQAAALATRARKKETDREVIYGEWKSRAKQLGINFDKERDLGNCQAVNKELGEIVAAEAAKRSMRFAINHLTERQAIIGERDLIDVAMKHAIGHARLTDIEGALQGEVKSGFLIREAPLYRPAAFGWQGAPKTRAAWAAELTANGNEFSGDRVDRAILRGSLTPIEPRYTTQTAIERENRILSIERLGRHSLQPVMAVERAAAALEGTGLNEGQRSAVVTIVSTRNRVVGIQGLAGTGKSHMLKEAKKLIVSEGYEVHAVAPYGSQVKELRRLGVESVTVAAFLKAQDKRIDAKTVLVLDEAGPVPARQMSQVLGLVQKTGARIVLLGDSKQLPAIQAGRPFGQLQQAGMETATMDQIQRQKNPELKIAVEHAAMGDTVRSLANITVVTQIANGKKRREAIAAAYVALPSEEREHTIVVSGTNEARRDINRLVRKALGTAGTGESFDTLIRRDTTAEERKWSRYYRPGDIVQPERDYERSGLKRGHAYTIYETGPGNQLTVTSEDGQKITFNPMTIKYLSVYEPERQEMAVGDSVKITRNDAKLDISNGDRFLVVGVEGRRLRLDNGERQLDLYGSRPIHVDHAIVSTIHSAQGLTSDRVFIDAESERATTSKQAWYVAISRARHEARVFTDDKAKLPAAISRENVKHAARDLVRDRRQLETA